MYDGIIFDIDGTLWDSRKGVAEAWNLAVRENTDYDITFDYEEIGKLFGKPMSEIFDILFPSMPKEQRAGLIELLYRYEHEYLEKHPPALYDGTRETLSKLLEKYPLFIVTNAQKGYIECLFNATGIGGFFTDTLCYGDTLSPKDVTMRRLIERNALENPVYIGDTQGDYEACRKAGIPMIYAAYGLGDAENPQYSIDSIRRLADLLL